MDISLLHAGLAAGAAMAALPVILHLFMKQTPKRIVFPALRLIKERQKRSRKKLRIKNWLLLLARMAVLALMALALARPTLYSQTTLGDREVPTALGLVFDTSLSMGYKERDKTRLEEAKERAAEILKKLPETSQVFVVDSSDPVAPVGLSPAAARKRIEGLTLRATYRPLNAAVGQAYAAVADCDRERREVYVLTDLARSAWDMNRPAEGLDKRKAAKAHIMTVVLRLSPKEVIDVAVVEAEPSATIATQGEAVEIKARLRAFGPAVSRRVDFYLDGVPKGKQIVPLPANGEAEVRFLTPKLDPKTPLHQGYVHVAGADPLAFDDFRYFTFKVQPARKVLLVSDLDIDAEFVADALDPLPMPGIPRTCQVDRIKGREFGDKARETLKDYTCVFLLNATELNEADWGRLSVYVRDGGGLIVGAGDHCLAENYNTPSAAQLLPATLVGGKSLKEPTTFGKVADFTHPLFTKYVKDIEPGLSQVPVSRYWTIKAPPTARVLLTFADGAPALVERTFKGAKTGRVLLWTTPLARRVDPKSPAAWNEFPQFWPFLAIVLQTVPYMAGTIGERLNYEAGEDVLLPIDPTRRFKNYTVKQQDEETSNRLSPSATTDTLVITSPQPVGQWSVTATGPDNEKETLGFSINPPQSETKFTMLAKNDLDMLFGPPEKGKEHYVLADDPVKFDKAVNEGRFGSELFPWLMFLILLLVTLENLLANKFHREAGQRAAAGTTTPTHAAA